MGGFLKGRSFSYGEGKEAKFVICWGNLTGDPETKAWGEKIKTSFNIKLHTKTYENCVVWGDNEIARTAQALEKGDVVVCIGMEVTSTFTNKKGETKTYYDLNCDCIIPPQQVTNFTIGLAQSARINEILNAEHEEMGSDGFESAADFEDSGDGFESAGDFDENGEPFMEVPDDMETPFM